MLYAPTADKTAKWSIETVYHCTIQITEQPIKYITQLPTTLNNLSIHKK